MFLKLHRNDWSKAVLLLQAKWVCYSWVLHTILNDFILLYRSNEKNKWMQLDFHYQYLAHIYDESLFQWLDPLKYGLGFIWLHEVFKSKFILFKYHAFLNNIRISWQEIVAWGKPLPIWAIIRVKSLLRCHFD